MLTLTPELARQFANSTLGHVDREYPHGLAHFMRVPETITPRTLHPVFFGSFDWHSCVHAWWQLFRLARLYPELSPDILVKAQTTFTKGNIQAERDYLTQNSSFERPYGWGWLLALHHEMSLQCTVDPVPIGEFAADIAARFTDYLPKLSYPVRAGAHANTAFALILAHEWATHHDEPLKNFIEGWAMTRFAEDYAAPHIEPSGEDFLSPTLTEAVLMSLSIPASSFPEWFASYLPKLPENLLTPVGVSDRSDGRIGHLDGLNLSRAWCWRILARRLPHIREQAEQAAERQIAAALPHLQANYMSEHWLCSFALLALTGTDKA